MSFLHRIPLPVHAFIELTVGLALVMSPLVLMLGGVGTVLTFTAGVVLAGMGIGAVETLSLSAHQALDRFLVIVLAGASAAVALWGDPLPAVMLLAGAMLLMILTSATKWTRPPIPRT